MWVGASGASVISVDYHCEPDSQIFVPGFTGVLHRHDTYLSNMNSPYFGLD